MIEKVQRIENEAESIAVIEEQCFSSPWSKEQIISTVNGVFYVAKENEKTVAYAGLYYVLDEAYVTNIGVLPKYRRQGIGGRLMESLISFCINNKMSFLSLEVRKSNFAAINLYNKFGFKKVGERKNYYTAPDEDAQIMTRFFK